MSNGPTETENDIENTINEINDKNVEGTQKPTENGDIFNFEPFLYSFKISPFSHSSSTMLTTISYDRLHQDHAFGIIWLLFSEQNKIPNIFQLHWGLKFLKKLKNNNGTYTEDVNKCIQMIQDNLIKQYAKLGISLKHINKSTMDYENRIVTSTPKPQNVQKNFDMNMSRELIESTDKDFNFQSCGKTCGREVVLKENASKLLSFTYNEMVSKGQAPCMAEANLNEKFIKDLQLPKEFAANMSTKELLQFFNNVRKEYVETIKKQVETISSIENFVQNIDKNSFKAYVTNDLMKYLNELEDSNNDGSVEKLIV